MSRFTGPQHKGAQKTLRAERREDADKRNAVTVPERTRQHRRIEQGLAQSAAGITVDLGVFPADGPAPDKRKRTKK